MRAQINWKILRKKNTLQDNEILFFQPPFREKSCEIQFLNRSYLEADSALGNSKPQL